MKCLSYYCDTPATQQLMERYGPHLERLAIEDCLAIAAGITIAVHWMNVCPAAEPELLAACTSEIDYSFNDAELAEIIQQLDSELDSGWLAMQLVSGLASIVSMRMSGPVAA
ncbi:MAG: hypothetical protein F6K04_02370 [Leptolyngbya sp. SIO4C5]|nr:hypothetical protein [Leptolyngbya sp. SIO4C5]